MAGRSIIVDGFNVLVTVEAMLSGGLLLRCADGGWRDIASVHGSYRRVAETHEALARLATALGDAAAVRVLLDRPVSNSGRLAGWFRDAGLPAETHDHVDAELVASGWPVATADGVVIDRATAWVDLVSPMVPGERPWTLDLAPPG